MMAAYYKWALIYEINNELGETFYNTAAIWRRWIQNELSIHECIQMATNGASSFPLKVSNTERLHIWNSK